MARGLQGCSLVADTSVVYRNNGEKTPMRAAVLETLYQRMNDETLDQIGSTLGTDPGTTRKAISIALAVLIGGLAHEANHSRSHAEQLARKLDKDYSDVATPTPPSEQSVDYILGQKRSIIESGISTVSGLDLSRVHELLPLLAPLVLHALSQVRQAHKLDADRLASLLNRERAEVERNLPQLRRGALLDLLEHEDENQIVKEVQKISAGVTREGVFGKILGSV